MIAIGDKVVCVDDTPGIDRLAFTLACGPVVKGEVYVIESISVWDYIRTGKELAFFIVGKPAVHPFFGNVPWRASRFRKLEDHRAQQELAYYRSEPTKVHA